MFGLGDIVLVVFSYLIAHVSFCVEVMLQQLGLMTDFTIVSRSLLISSDPSPLCQVPGTATFEVHDTIWRLLCIHWGNSSRHRKMP